MRKLPFDEEIEPKDFGKPTIVGGRIVWNPPPKMDRRAAELLRDAYDSTNKLIEAGLLKIGKNGTLKVSK